MEHNDHFNLIIFIEKPNYFTINLKILIMLLKLLNTFIDFATLYKKKLAKVLAEYTFKPALF